MGHSAAQRLSGSVNDKATKVGCTRTNHFIKFIKIYRLEESYLTNDVEVTDKIMACYVIFLQNGFSINNIKIQAGTIEGYMRCVNNHYKKYRYNPPFDKKTETDAANLIKNQAKFEKAPDKREPLHDQVIIKMYELSKECDRYGFHRGAWLWTRLGCFGGFRCQEFVMGKKNEIQFYVMPDSTLVV